VTCESGSCDASLQLYELQPASLPVLQHGPGARARQHDACFCTFYRLQVAAATSDGLMGQENGQCPVAAGACVSHLYCILINLD